MFNIIDVRKKKYRKLCWWFSCTWDRPNEGSLENVQHHKSKLNQLLCICRINWSFQSGLYLLSVHCDINPAFYSVRTCKADITTHFTSLIQYELVCWNICVYIAKSFCCCCCFYLVCVKKFYYIGSALCLQSRCLFLSFFKALFHPKLFFVSTSLP